MLVSDSVESNRRSVVRVIWTYLALGLRSSDFHWVIVVVHLVLLGYWLCCFLTQISVMWKMDSCEALAPLIANSIQCHLAKLNDNGVWGLGFGVWGLGFG